MVKEEAIDLGNTEERFPFAGNDCNNGLKGKKCGTVGVCTSSLRVRNRKTTSRLESTLLSYTTKSIG